LFSYRKGWLLYTPMMVFPLIGFYFVFKNNKQIFYASIIYFLISFYTISSWTEWWYGGGFSIRPLIATYPVLAICLGYFLQFVSERNLFVKLPFAILAMFFLFLNQFQWWQYNHYILDPYRTTKAYYWASFLKTNVSESDRDLLRVYRDFSGKMEFTEKEKYQGKRLFSENFDGIKKGECMKEGTNCFYRLKEGQEYFPIFESRYEDLTQKDHLWIKASLDIRFPEDFEGTLPCLVMSVDRAPGPYGYSAMEIKPDSIVNQWKHVEIMYLTPEIRDGEDKFKCYVWKRGQSFFDIDNLKLDIYERK